MTKKNLLLTLLAASLAVVYGVWFTHWFRPATVRIFHVSRNLRAGPSRGNALPNLIFGCAGNPVRLTELRVVPLATYETNKHAAPLWHLVSDSNSVPVKTFFYGQFIGGMRLAMKGVPAGPLESNVTYRLLITAGRVNGQHDFELK
jgi:hypothetical protein